MMLRKINEYQRRFRRNIIDRSYRKRLTNRDFTIFSSNCVGGVIYNSLGLRFLSPTINLYFDAKDFLRFLQNPRSYTIEAPMFTEIKDTNEPWPVVQINDVIVHFMHYQSFEEAVNKWNQRSMRINWDNIYVFFTEGGGTYSDMIAFDNMNYPNKVVFTHKEIAEIKSSVYLQKAQWVDIEGTGATLNYPLTGFIGKTSPLRYIDEYNYVDFLNGKG